MRISDWGSDVCSSDLDREQAPLGGLIIIEADGKDLVNDARCLDDAADARLHQRREPGVGKQAAQPDHGGERRSEERREGKSVSVRVDLGGRRFIKKQQKQVSKSIVNRHTIIKENLY